MRNRCVCAAPVRTRCAALGPTRRSCARRRTWRSRRWRPKPERWGAHAVVGVDLDYEHIGGASKSMRMVTASGTAVNLE